MANLAQGLPDDVPAARRAVLTGVTLIYDCPACGVAMGDTIDAEPDAWGGFSIPIEDRFDLCSHCGELLDFGATLSQGGA